MSQPSATVHAPPRQGDVLGQSVDRLDEHGGVARPGESPRRIAQRAVVALSVLALELAAREAQHRARLLGRLAGLVHRLVAVGPFLAGAS